MKTALERSGRPLLPTLPSLPKTKDIFPRNSGFYGDSTSKNLQIYFSCSVFGNPLSSRQLRGRGGRGKVADFFAFLCSFYSYVKIFPRRIVRYFFSGVEFGVMIIGKDGGENEQFQKVFTSQQYFDRQSGNEMGRSPQIDLRKTLNPSDFMIYQ